MAKHAGSFDMILDTVSADHDINALLGAPQARRDAGPGRRAGQSAGPERLRPAPAPPEPRRLAHRRHSPRRRRCSTSAAKHGVVCDIELIPIQKINEAYERMLRSDVKYRFVIDIASLRV